MTVDELLKYAEELLKRKLTGDEIIIMGIAFIQGILAEREKKGNE